MTNPERSVPETVVRKAAETMEAESIRSLGRDLGTLHRDDIARAALESVWPEPMFTPEEINDLLLRLPKNPATEFIKTLRRKLEDARDVQL